MTFLLAGYETTPLMMKLINLLKNLLFLTLDGTCHLMDLDQEVALQEMQWCHRKVRSVLMLVLD